MPLREKWTALFREWNDLAMSFDKGLESAIDAQKTKVMNGLLNLEKKLIRSAKRKESDSLRMIQEVKDSLFPGGGLQERHDNFISLYLEFGEDLIPLLLENVKPFSNQFHWVIDAE